jgi:hypothetical protein
MNYKIDGSNNSISERSIRSEFCVFNKGVTSNDISITNGPR